MALDTRHRRALEFRFFESAGNAARGLQLATLDFKVLENAARNPLAVASQSSTLANAANPIASKAIDGNTDGSFNNASVTHTSDAVGDDVFWQVDLGRDYDLEEVLLYNRTDCCSDRLSNFRLSVGNDGTSIFSQDYFVGSGSVGTDVFLIDIPNVIGDLVRIELIGGFNNVGGGQNTLSLAEVQVFGTVVVPEPTTCALMLLGFVGLVSSRRRRRR